MPIPKNAIDINKQIESDNEAVSELEDKYIKKENDFNASSWYETTKELNEAEDDIISNLRKVVEIPDYGIVYSSIIDLSEEDLGRFKSPADLGKKYLLYRGNVSGDVIKRIRNSLAYLRDTKGYDVSTFITNDNKSFNRGGLTAMSDDEWFIDNKKRNGIHTMRRLIKHGRPYKCEICGLEGNWNERPLTLQLHHINGRHEDNREENLQILCPNCHSQTDGYANRSNDIYEDQ